MSTGFATQFSRALITHAPRTTGASITLHLAVQEALQNRGRFVRAALILESAQAQGIPAPKAQELACAVEYWHMASLILDDLPCMDDASERRGRACLHKRFGEATAVLTALAFINRAYALANHAFSSRPARLRRQAMRLVDTVLGPSGLVGGQAHDLSFSKGLPTARDTSRVAWLKTGTLLWLCVALPALWTPAPLRHRRALRRVCGYWGLAYQAADDLNDLLSNSLQSGKTAGRDALLGRPNLARALGVPAARARIQRLLTLAGRTIQVLSAEDPRHLYLARWHEQVFMVRESKRCAA